MQQKIETIILSKLFNDEDYLRKVIPFIKEDYFMESSERKIYAYIHQFVTKYNSLPTIDAINIAMQNDKSVNENEYKSISETLTKLDDEIDVNEKWILDETEKFCKDKAVYNAILNGIQIIEGKDKEHTAEAIPSILSEALAVAFDQNVGHDYVEDGENRFEFYHKKEEKIEFDLDYFNRITKGGIPQKTLNIALGLVLLLALSVGQIQKMFTSIKLRGKK